LLFASFSPGKAPRLARIFHEYFSVWVEGIIKPPSPQSSPLKGKEAKNPFSLGGRRIG